MEKRILTGCRTLLIGGAVFLFLAAATTASATIHVIDFGGSVGFNYDPNSLSVTVGDTIEWRGNFNLHPLSSTSVPGGAATFGNGSGSVYQYVVTAAGTYNYQCDNHFGSGMVGSFTASITSVGDDPSAQLPMSVELNQNYPNPFNPTTTIRFGLPHKGTVRLMVYNAIGQMVSTLVQGELEAGFHQITFDASNLTSGVYLYRLQAGDFVQTRKLVLLR